MISDKLEAKKRHKNFYRNNLKRMLNLLFMATLVVLFLVVFTLYRFFTLPSPYYFATSADGTLTQLLTVPKGTGLVERNQT